MGRGKVGDRQGKVVVGSKGEGWGGKGAGKKQSQARWGGAWPS